jgi:putative transposase
MPWKKATPIEISEKEKIILTEKAKGTHTPLHIKIRSKIILKAAEGKTNNAIEREMDINSETVKIWRDRYGGQKEELKKAEAESPHKMRDLIEEILSDAPRPGTPPKFLDEQVAAIIALSLEDPARLGLPFSNWTPELLQVEAIERGIVESISVRQVGRFLKRKGFTTEQMSKLAES